MIQWALDAENVLWKCPACSHIKRDLEMCRANARTHPWGGVVAYDRIRNMLTFRSMKRHIAVKAEAGGSPNVLDIGFGVGLLLKNWIARGWSAFGVEAETLEIPVDPLVQEKAQLQFCKVEQADLPDSSFDLIYAIHVIEHIDQPAAVFRKCYEILKKDGVLYFMTPNARSLGLEWFKAHWWNLEDPTHIRFYSPESITRMLKDAGFTSVRVKIPVWDSVMMESNSIFRMLSTTSNENGILNKPWARIPIMLLAAPYLVSRFFIRRISPSIEIVASK
jgi:2-polyprenyl-3-methyl-5-hydroxy-6-metoxy-1,4-benzoquinol methylase